MRRAVVLLPGGLLPQSEIRSEVDDLHIRGEVSDKSRRLTVRESEKDDVGFRQHGCIGGVEHQVGETREVRVHGAHPLASPAARRDGGDLDGRVTRKQPQQLATRIAGGAGNRSPDHGWSIRIRAYISGQPTPMSPVKGVNFAQ